MLRNLRWVVAGIAAIVAVCSSPARSSADIQILVQELSASNTVIASSSFSGTPSGNTFFQPFSYSSANPNSMFTLSGTVATNSASGTFNSSLDASFTGGFNSNFNAPAGNTIKITVTDTGFKGNNLPTPLLNTAGASQGFTGGAIEVDSFSRILIPPFTPGTPLGSPTPTASDSVPATPSNNQQTHSNFSGLPGSYAIQQVITIAFTQAPGATIDEESTFGGTAGARIDPSAVPAPGGLALALVGLPLIGLRRALRKRAAA
jgi:hypothetical protein